MIRNANSNWFVFLKGHNGQHFRTLKYLKEDVEKIPLPEDIILQGLPILKSVQDVLDWEFLRHHCLHTKEEVWVQQKNIF